MKSARYPRKHLALALLLASPLALGGEPAVELLGTYSQPDPAAAFDESAAEIVAFDTKLGGTL